MIDIGLGWALATCQRCELLIYSAGNLAINWFLVLSTWQMMKIWTNQKTRTIARVCELLETRERERNIAVEKD